MWGRNIYVSASHVPFTFTSWPHDCLARYYLHIMLPRLIRPGVRTLQKPYGHRPFYSKSAKFVTLDAQGRPSNRTINIWVGDKHEAYVLVPTDVGNAIKVACAQNGTSCRTDSESLIWHHDRRCFTCSRCPRNLLATLTKYLAQNRLHI